MDTVDSLLLPYQSKWISDQSPVKFCIKSRRIGVTYAEACAAALLAAQSKGGDTIYCSYNLEISRDFIREVSNWAKAFQIAASEMEEVVIKDEKKDVMAYRVVFDSGYQVLGLPGNPNNLRGRKAARVIIDEAAFVEDLNALLQAAMPLRVWGCKLSVISTHNGVDSHFNQILEEIRAGKKSYSLHSYDIHQALADGLYKRICLVSGQAWSEEAEQDWVEAILADAVSPEEEYLCIPRSAGDDVYFPSVMVQNAQAEESPTIGLTLPPEFASQPEGYRTKMIDKWCQESLKPLLDSLDPNCKNYFGLDFGRSSDLTCIAPIVEYAKYKLSCPWMVELRQVPFEAQKQILFYFVDHLPWFVRGAMDATGSGSYLAEVAVQKYGANRVEAITLSTKFYTAAYPKYKSSLTDGVLTIPAGRDILNDHKLVRLKDGVAKIPSDSRFKGSDNHMRHGDSVVALLLANWAAVQKTVVHYPGNVFASTRKAA